MNNQVKYSMLAQGESFLPSTMGIIPRNNDKLFTAGEIENALKMRNHFEVISFDEKDDPFETSPKTFAAQIKYLNKNYDVKFNVCLVSELRLEEFGLGNMIDEEDYNKALSRSKFIEVSLEFSENPLESFHLQLKLLDAVVPDASLVIDFMSYRLLSGKWLSMAAATRIKPSPEYLYTLHAVYDEKPGRTEYWFHTHGLLRCGCAEIEILNVNSGPQQMHNLINNIAKRFLSGNIQENKSFLAGFDGLEISMLWIRWEEALKNLPEDILGGIKDREGEDNAHANPSGILLGIEDGNIVSPEIYISSLTDNPVLYISNSETKRMSQLAKERFPYLLELFKSKNQDHNPKTGFFKKLFNKDKNESKWTFLVKLGLIVDDAGDQDQKEHLWFELLSFDKDNITCKLTNQPYWISDLNQGDVRTYPVELLTDWLIFDHEGRQYTPDSIYYLININEV